MSAPGDHPFERKPVEGSANRLIESKCVLCGFRIVGSVVVSLKDDEAVHADTCPKKKKDSAAAH